MKPPPEVIAHARSLEPVSKWLNELDQVIAACQVELGYEDGDLLANIRRFKAFSQSEIDNAKAGAHKLAEFCQKLQAKLDPDMVLEISKQIF